MIHRASLSILLSFMSAFFALLPNSTAFAQSDMPTDEMLATCARSGARDESFCVRNTLAGFINTTLRTVSYQSARQIIFTKIDAYAHESGGRAVDSVYSPHVWITGGRVEERSPRGNGTFSFNIEHTWPQMYLKKFPQTFSKTQADMFHLFPVEMQVNSSRGNLPFADCRDNTSESTERVSYFCHGGFEPPAQQRGKVARAMFYMAVTYNMKIDEAQETVLRQWHDEFPVTAAEFERDRRIHDVQGVHNPFILHPEWVSRISDF